MYIGIDIGGSKTNAILFDSAKKKIIEKIKKETPQNKDDFLNSLLSIIRNFDLKKIKGIGIGIAGALDIEKGKILASANMPFLDNFLLKGFIEKEFGLSVFLDNDARCFLRGEWFYGKIKGCDSAVGITLGTGIGGAILINGKIISGAHDSAGEMGHMMINVKNEVLSFEDLVSKKGIKRLTDKSPRELGVVDKEILDEIGFYLGIGLANLVNILDPQVIVIGGGLSKLGDLILEPAKSTMEKFIISPKAKQIKISPSQLGDDASAMGAASLFLKR